MYTDRMSKRYTLDYTNHDENSYLQYQRNLLTN